jgi:hypothetical protein
MTGDQLRPMDSAMLAELREDIRGRKCGVGDGLALALEDLVRAHDYWRARCPVTAEDIERAGLTWMHVDAWVRAQPDGAGETVTDGRPLAAWRKRRGNPDGATWQHGLGPLIHRGQSLAFAVAVAARAAVRPTQEVLAEMAAMETSS